MAIVNQAAYLNSVGWTAVTAWAANTTKVAGNLVRQLAAPAVGSERVFACYSSTSGTGQTGASEPAWGITNGLNTVDNNVKWLEVTGQPPMNGDAADSQVWTANQTWTRGQTIIDSNNNVQVCWVAGAGGTGSHPTWASFSNAGATTADNVASWVNLGPITNFQVNGFAAPHARIQAVAGAGWLPSTLVTVAGQTGYGMASIFVSKNHAETQAAAMSVTGLGTAAIPVTLISCNDTSWPPTSEIAGATVTTSGASAMTLTGVFWSRGVSYACGTGATNVTLSIGTTAGWAKIENGTLSKLGTTGISTAITIGGIVCSAVEFVNVTTVFGATGDSIAVEGPLKITNNAGGSNTFVSASGSLPSSLFVTNSTRPALLDCYGVDLSNLTGTIFNLGGACWGHANFWNCKRNNSSALTSGTPTNQANFDVRFWDVDSTTGNTYNQYAFSNYQTGSGITNQTETTTVKTGGSSDGTTPFSRKIVTGANCSYAAPFVCDPIAIFIPQSKVGTAITPVISFAGSTGLYNNQIWCEVEYLGSSASPQSSIASDGLSTPLSTASLQPTDSVSAWGGSPASKQTLGPTFTPQRYGVALLRVKIAAPSLTVYIDQEPTGFGFVSGRQYQHMSMMMNEGPGLALSRCQQGVVTQ